MIWLGAHRTALLLALSRLGRAPLGTVLSLLAIGIALALPAGGQLLLDNSVALARHVAPGPQISLFLRNDADARMLTETGSRLAAQAGIAHSEFISREATLARFKRTGGLRDVLEALPDNPFPHAWIITPSDTGPQAMEQLAQVLRGWPAVEHVQLDSDWVRRLDALLRLSRSAVWVLAGLLGTGLVAVTFNITRMQVLTQRAEIEVSELLGATRAFIRRPFMYFGTLLGLGGGLIAWLLVHAGAQWLRAPMAELAALYGLQFEFVGLGLVHSLLLFVLAGTLGAVGTALSLRQYLR